MEVLLHKLWKQVLHFVLLTVMMQSIILSNDDIVGSSHQLQNHTYESIIHDLNQSRDAENVQIYLELSGCNVNDAEITVYYNSDVDILTYNFNLTDVFLLDGSTTIPGFQVDVYNFDGDGDIGGHSFGEGISMPATAGEFEVLCVLNVDMEQTFVSDLETSVCFFNAGFSAELDGVPHAVEFETNLDCLEFDICCVPPVHTVPDYEFGQGPDCNDECFGGAFIDECDECVGGSTGALENWGMDECGVCFGDNDCCGCTDPLALNYDPDALIDDGCCVFSGSMLPGCEDEILISNTDGSMSLEIAPYTEFFMYGEIISEEVEMLMAPYPFPDEIYPPDRLSLEEIIENLPDEFELGDDDIYSFAPHDIWFSINTFITIPHKKFGREVEGIYVFGLDNSDDETWTMIPYAVCDEYTCTFPATSLGLYAVMTPVPGMSDCSGIVEGGAFIDNCGDCVGGSTGLTQCSLDCAGNWGGDLTMDACGNCDTDSDNDFSCYGCTDPEAYNFDDSVVFDDGSCSFTPMPGDISMDWNVDVSDILVIVEIVLYDLIPTDYQLEACDLYSDGLISILDLLYVVNIILDGALGLKQPVHAAKIELDKNQVTAELDGIAAIIKLNVTGQFEINQSLLGEGWQVFYNNQKILIIDLTGNNACSEISFEYSGELVLESAEVVDWHGNLVNGEVSNQLPEDYQLLNTYPNPFNSSATIEYSLSVNSAVQIIVYDLLGKQVDQIFEGTRNAGLHSIDWDADALTSGVYILQVQSASGIQNSKVILLK